MDRKTVLTKTAKGLMEAAGKTSLVSRDVRNVLTLIDGKATVGDLQAKLKIPEPKLNAHLATLMRTGLVREFVMAPASISPLSQLSALGQTLDFASMIPPRDLAREAAQQNAEADAIAREIVAAAQARDERAIEASTAVEAETPRPVDSIDPFAAFRVRADLALREAEQRVHAEAEKARIELRAKAEREATERSKQEVEAKRQADEEAQRRKREEAARTQAEQARERSQREAQELARREEEERQGRARTELDRRAATEKALKEAQDRAQREAAEKSRAAAGAKAQRDAKLEEARASQLAVDASAQKPPPVAPEVRTDISPETTRKAEEEVKRKAAREEERAKAKAQAEMAAKARKEERAREIAEAEARAIARVREREREAALVASRIHNIRQGRRGSLGPRIFLAIILLLALGLLIVPMLPVDAQRYESMARAKLGVPVTIGHASYALFPLPHLELKEVLVGEDTKIAELHAKPQLGSLWSEFPAFSEVELIGVQARPAMLGSLLWGRMSADAVMPEQVLLRDLRLNGLNVPNLSGGLNTDAAGMRVINLKDGADDLSVRITRQGEEAIFELRAKNSQAILPLSIGLQDLNARGTADARGIRISAFDAGLNDGVLKGSATLNWQNGWELDGKLEAVQLDAALITPALGGRLRGTGQFQMRSAQWADLAQSFKLSGNFEIEKGQINGFDLVRSLREGQAAGKTSFALLRGQGSAEKGKLSLRGLSMDGGLVKADGNAEATSQAVNGRMSVEMRTAAGPLRSNYSLSGSPEALQIQR